jgi:hypothetical protein
MAKDIAAQLARIKEQEEKLAKRKSALEQKAKTEDRKRDTRRKIVVGGAVLDHMQKDSDFARVICDLLAQSVGRPTDKEVIADLLDGSPLASPTMRTPSNDTQAPAALAG